MNHDGSSYLFWSLRRMFCNATGSYTDNHLRCTVVVRKTADVLKRY